MAGDSNTERQLYDLLLVGIGVSLGFVGLVALFRPGFYSTQYARYIDFGPHHDVVGVIIIVVGVALAWAGLRARRRRSPGS